MEPRGPRHANNMTSLSCKGPALDACHTPPTRDRKEIHCKLDPCGTCVDPPSKWTRKDSRGQAWTRQYRPVDPQDFLLDTRLKTRPVQDCFYLGPIMLPRSKWSTAAKTGLCGGFIWGLQKHGETCLAWTFLHSTRRTRSSLAAASAVRVSHSNPVLPLLNSYSCRGCSCYLVGKFAAYGALSKAFTIETWLTATFPTPGKSCCSFNLQE